MHTAVHTWRIAVSASLRKRLATSLYSVFGSQLKATSSSTRVLSCTNNSNSSSNSRTGRPSSKGRSQAQIKATGLRRLRKINIFFFASRALYIQYKYIVSVFFFHQLLHAYFLPRFFCCFFFLLFSFILFSSYYFSLLCNQSRLFFWRSVSRWWKAFCNDDTTQEQSKIHYTTKNVQLQAFPPWFLRRYQYQGREQYMYSYSSSRGKTSLCFIFFFF